MSNKYTYILEKIRIEITSFFVMWEKETKHKKKVKDIMSYHREKKLEIED